jgi:hypothetical protein
MTSRAAITALSLGVAAASFIGLGPASAQAPVVAPAAIAAPAAPTTDLTLAVRGCNGCRLQLVQAVQGRPRVWHSKQRTVRDGSVSWTIRTMRTHDLSITVLAPWDGGVGAEPTVAFRYNGTRPGDPVTNALARTKRRASGCWAGTARAAITLPITVAHAHATNPPGDPVRTPRAFTSVTQRWEKPMYRAWHGITGTQDAVYCG